MHRKTRLKINPSLNPHLICVLCGGYLIDATTIVECLHSFCKTCIVRYLESSKFCPICDVQVHKTKPFTNIRLDHTLQDLVYKLVPGLFQNEMKRRRDFYKERGQDVDSMWNDPNRPEYYTDDDGEIQRERVIFAEDEQISLALHLSPDGKSPKPSLKSNEKMGKESGDCRYLLCPAVVTIGLLKKFIRLKFSLSDRYQIDMYHTDEVLSDFYTLIDVAYIYMWRRKEPLCLYYTVYTNPAKRFKREISCTETLNLEKVKATTAEVEIEKKNTSLDDKPERENEEKSKVNELEESTQSITSLHENNKETKTSDAFEKTIPPSSTLESITSLKDVKDSISAMEITESKKGTSESKRETNELGKETNETNRGKTESKRETNESKSEISESKREAIKSKRESTESKRETTESKRETTESKRETIESKREISKSISEKCEPSKELTKTNDTMNSVQTEKHNTPSQELQEKVSISKAENFTLSQKSLKGEISCSESDSNKIKAIPMEIDKSPSKNVSSPSFILAKSPAKKEKHSKSKSEKQPPTPTSKSAILVVPTSDISSSANRIPKLKLNTSKYTSQGIVTKSTTLTTPVYYPRVTQKPTVSTSDSNGADKLPSNMADKTTKKMCTQDNCAKSSSLDKCIEKKIFFSKSSPAKNSTTEKINSDTSSKSTSTAKSKISQNGSAKVVSNNDINVKNESNKLSIKVGATNAPTAAVPTITSKQGNKPSSNGQKLKLTVPYSSYGCYTNGLTIPSPIGLSPTVTSPRPYPSSPLNRTLSSSPTRRKTSSPSRRIPSTTTNGRLTPGSSVSPSSLYSLSPSPTNRSFPTSPSPHSFNPTARILQTSPLARHMSSSTGRIFSFPERGPPISHMPITVPTAHSHLNLRLNTSPLYSNNASPHNGDLPQDLSIKKKTSSIDDSEPPSSTLKIPIKVPIKTNGLPNGEIDKFAFTDEEDEISPLASRKLHPIKAEPGSGT
ncbi:polycomb group protein Psc-like [Saccostrea echinata]|uniref:polycomb group protein Psc-like n=1 Tax=Saccostrea echinata TaxID=191078 RepID=UPI002A80A149|nr:polycomb group protein Psc-like [Saccostrea echinata]